MAAALLKVSDRYQGTVSVRVAVEEVSANVVRLLSMRPLRVGDTAELTNGTGVWTGRVSRCHRALTGLYELSLVLAV